MRSSLFAYSFSHFCVDFACFWLLFGRVMAAGLPLESVSLMFLAYNIVAFGLQAPLGHLCDIWPRIPAGVIGCAVVAAGLLASSSLWPALLLAALGNAVFHVGGGIDSLSDSRMWRSGVFVSTGAPGVALGTLAGKSGLSLALPLGMLLLSGVLVAALAPRRKAPPAQFALDVSSRAPFAALILLASLSIVIRAYVGAVLPLPWKSASALMGLLPAAFAFAGKAAGGILADRLGARNVGVISLLASLPCLALGNAVPAAAMAGLALFNMTMPITLCALASRLQDSTGFAFGLSTLALLIGTVPTFFFRLPDGTAPYVIAALIALSALFVLLSTRNQEGCLSHKPSESIQYPAV
jgi:FSR family fosmidomycin resistance protein-like MFS transporter